jgi:hypothetical protein
MEYSGSVRPRWTMKCRNELVVAPPPRIGSAVVVASAVRSPVCGYAGGERWLAAALYETGVALLTQELSNSTVTVLVYPKVCQGLWPSPDKERN